MKIKFIKHIFFLVLATFLYGCDKQKNNAVDTKYFICEGQTIYTKGKREIKVDSKASISISKGNFDRKNSNNPQKNLRVIGKVNFDSKIGLEICHEDELNLYLNVTCDVSSEKEKRRGSLNKGRFEKVSGWFVYREEYDLDDSMRIIDEYYYKCSITNPVIN